MTDLTRLHAASTAGDALKACPFCGGAATRVEFCDYDQSPKESMRVGFKCSVTDDLSHGGTDMPVGREAEAIAAWNRRTDSRAERMDALLRDEATVARLAGPIATALTGGHPSKPKSIDLAAARSVIATLTAMMEADNG